MEKKTQQFCKARNLPFLEQKLRRKPGKKDQVDLFINKKSGTNPPCCHWSQCFAFGAFPLPHPKRRKPHNNSLPPPGRSERVPKPLITEKTEPPRDHHVYTVFKSSRGDTLKWFMYSNSISLCLVANKVTCHRLQTMAPLPRAPVKCVQGSGQLTSVSRIASMSCLWKRIARWTSVYPTSKADGRLSRRTSSAVSWRAMSPPDDL